MARYIDADKLVAEIREALNLRQDYKAMMSYFCFEQFIELLEETPTADVVEVVRCAKCKHGDVSILSKTKDGEECVGCYCTLKNVVTNTDSYCPSGRRRDVE